MTAPRKEVLAEGGEAASSNLAASAESEAGVNQLVAIVPSVEAASDVVVDYHLAANLTRVDVSGLLAMTRTHSPGGGAEPRLGPGGDDAAAGTRQSA